MHSHNRDCKTSLNSLAFLQCFLWISMISHGASRLQLEHLSRSRSIVVVICESVCATVVILSIDFLGIFYPRFTFRYPTGIDSKTDPESSKWNPKWRIRNRRFQFETISFNSIGSGGSKTGKRPKLDDSIKRMPFSKTSTRMATSHDISLC